MGSNIWEILPITPDKVYYTGKAPGTSAKYPGNEVARETAKIEVEAVSDAVIGIDTMTGLPFIANNALAIFGLDENGVAFGAAADLDYLKAGYAYALNLNALGIAHPALSTFAYILPDNDMSGGTKLTANVFNIDDPSEARSNSNLGWNLMTDVADINLPATSYVDYVITFDEGYFSSWIRDANADLSDFDELSNKYFDDDELPRGNGYFVHTMDK